MLDVGVAQFDGRVGRGLVCLTFGAAAVSDDKRGFIRGQILGQVSLHHSEILRAGDVLFGLFQGPIAVEQYNFARFHCFNKGLAADVLDLFFGKQPAA